MSVESVKLMPTVVQTPLVENNNVKTSLIEAKISWLVLRNRLHSSEEHPLSPRSIKQVVDLSFILPREDISCCVGSNRVERETYLKEFMINPAAALLNRFKLENARFQALRQVLPSGSGKEICEALNKPSGDLRWYQTAVINQTALQTGLREIIIAHLHLLVASRVLQESKSMQFFTTSKGISALIYHLMRFHENLAEKRLEYAGTILENLEQLHSQFLNCGTSFEMMPKDFLTKMIKIVESDNNSYYALNSSIVFNTILLQRIESLLKELESLFDFNKYHHQGAQDQEKVVLDSLKEAMRQFDKFVMIYSEMRFHAKKQMEKTHILDHVRHMKSVQDAAIYLDLFRDALISVHADVVQVYKDVATYERIKKIVEELEKKLFTANGLDLAKSELLAFENGTDIISQNTVTIEELIESM